MRPAWVSWFVACLAGLPAYPAAAQSTVGPNGYQCIVRHPVTARKVATLHVTEDGPFIVTARVSRDGSMTIVYGTQFANEPPILQRLAQHHECGHFELVTKSEFKANCYALRRLDEEGLLDAPAARLIRDDHCGMGRLHEAQGGSGIAYWEQTRALCSDLNLPPC